MSDTPAGWRRVSLGELAADDVLDIRAGYAQGAHNDQGNGIPHLRPFNVNRHGELDLARIKWIEPPDEDSQYWLLPGDVLFNNTNSEDLTGKTALFDSGMSCTYSNHMTRLRVARLDVVDPLWLASTLHQLWYSGFFRRLLRRYVGQASVSATRLRSVELPMPPVAEQAEIASALDLVASAAQAAESRAAALRDLRTSLRSQLLAGTLRKTDTNA